MEKPNKGSSEIAVSSPQALSSNSLTSSSRTQSAMQPYKDILQERYAEAKTSEERNDILTELQTVQVIDKENRQIQFSEEAAKRQMQQWEKQSIFQRWTQVGGCLSALGIGLYCLQAAPLAGLLFLILGVAGPLGYELGDIGSLFQQLKGIPENRNNLDDFNSDDVLERIQLEENSDARF